jgi:hypothetical protein
MLLPLLLAFALGTGPAQVSDCVLGRDINWISSFQSLPEQIKVEMLDQVGVMADVGEAFNPADVGTGPRHRFIRGGSYGNIWFVWYEHGGFGYHRHVAFFRLQTQSWA